IADLPDDQRAELVRLVRDAIAGERYFLSPRMTRLKSPLAWLDPASAEKPADTPYPVPLARRRSRRRGSRHAGSAPPRQARGTAAHTQAPQETGLHAEITDD